MDLGVVSAGIEWPGGAMAAWVRQPLARWPRTCAAAVVVVALVAAVAVSAVPSSPAAAQGSEGRQSGGGAGDSSDGSDGDGDDDGSGRGDGDSEGSGGRSVGSPCLLGSVVDQSDSVLVSDCVALWGFYSGLSDMGMLDDGGAAWGSSTGLADWFGVEVLGGRVASLHLSHAGVSGVLSASLGDLWGLETLNLAGNDLSGPIPPELGALGSLVTLSLAANGLSGPIPVEFGSLGSLEFLDLSGNDLSGPIPVELGDLGALRSLNLSGNALGGLIPAVLGEMASLEALFLDDNAFGWPPPANLVSPREGLAVFLPLAGGWAPAVPAAVVALSRVDALEVTWDAAAPGEPFVDGYRVRYRRAGASAWRTVQATSSGVLVGGLSAGVVYEVAVAAWNHNGTGTASSVVSAAPLESPCGLDTVVDQTQPLLVGDCEALWAQRRALTGAAAITGASSGSWGDQRPLGSWRGVSVTGGRVTALDLADMDLDGGLAAQLGSLSALTELDLSNNGLSGPVPAQLGSLAALEILDLSANALSGPVPAGLGSLGSLRALDLSLNALTGPVPPQLGSLAALEILDLAGNDHTGPIPAQLANLGSLSNLEVLRVSGAGLTGPIPAALWSLSSLVELHIDGGAITGSIPTDLAALSNLRRLHIGGGNITGTIPAQLADLTQLESLYISAPGLSGTLPDALGALAGLRTLWIKSANLSGTIPARYGDLTSLHTLYLSGGGLAGPVPANITSLTALERLYLHNNNLTGPIPAQLANLANLTTLWLANNNLTGPIPAALGAAANLETLDLRHNPLTWPPPTSLAEPPARLTVLLPDTPTWTPPPPEAVTATPGDSELTLAWDDPGAGTHYHVDAYTINHRPQGTTGSFTRTTATASPVTISGLVNGTTYDIFVTATNSAGTSTPSTTLTAAPSASARARQHPGGFKDIGTHDPARDINDNALPDLAAEGIFAGTGCNHQQGFLCPDEPITRLEVAVWLVRTVDATNATPADTPETFDDVDYTNTLAPFVERLYELEITAGCGTESLRYCPDSDIPRGQMAAFTERAFNPPPRPHYTPPAVTDIAGHYHRDDIEALLEADITDLCSHSPPMYCPNQPATRAHVATLIYEARCTLPAYTYHRPCYTPRPPPPSIPRPTIESIDPGTGSLTVHWSAPGNYTHDVTQWEITYHITGEPGSPQTLPVSGATIPATGATIGGLDHNTRYSVTVRGIIDNPDGTTTRKTASVPDTETTLEAVRLVALEVTQGLQNWQGNIELVQGKRTVVRAFLESNTGHEVTVTPILHLVQQSGTTRTILSSLTPVNGTPERSQPHPIDDHGETRFDAPVSTTGMRGSADGSAIFIIPDLAQWIGHDNPDAQGAQPVRTFTYWLDAKEGVVCEEEVNPRHECEATLTFTQVPVPQVTVVPVSIYGLLPDDAVIAEQMQRIATIMPVPRIDYALMEPQRYPAPDPRPSPSRIFFDIWRNRTPQGPGEVYLGIASHTSSADHRGTGFRSVAAWFTQGADGPYAEGPERNTGAHEFGHVIGLPHASRDTRPTATGLENRYELLCGEGTFFEPPDPDSPLDEIDSTWISRNLMDYPYQFGGRLALLGRLGQESLPWGLDIRLLVRHLNSIPSDMQDLIFIDPAYTYSLMSYCDGDSPQSKWMDQHHHDMAMRELQNIRWMPGGDPDQFLSTAREVLFVSGSFASRSTARNTARAGPGMEVRVEPLYTVLSARPVASSTVGEYVLELLDAAGAVVASARFGAWMPLEGQASGSVSDGTAYWSVAVPDPPLFASYRIRSSDETLVEAAASASPPIVSVVSPGAGSVLSGSTVEVSWSASDADGDTLSYRVDYSSDGGASYRTIASGLSAAAVAVERRWLAGSQQARFRVIASDGVNSSWAESGLVEVAASAPRVVIMSPAVGAVVAGYGIVVLDAAGVDTEDGSLQGTSVVWTSSIDGVVANSAFAVLSTADLSVGVHTLTATATDSDNMTAQATVTLEVRATNEAPAATADVAHARSGIATLVDVLGNDTDPDDPISAGRVAVVVAPSAGTAAVAGGSRLEYVAGSDGYDVLVYQVCDRLKNCSSAEVTVAVVAGSGGVVA